MAAKPLQGMKVVMTGKFENYSRKDGKAALTAAGASVSSSVSGKTQLLIAGKDAGSKLYDAHDKGVPILGEGHLEKILAGEPVEDVIALARTFYTIDYAEASDNPLNFAGGLAPIGADRWPTYDGPMDHLFTLDVHAMPALMVYLPGVRAISLFVSDRSTVDMYEIHSPYNSKMRLVRSTQEQLDAAGDPPEGIEPLGERPLALVEHSGDEIDSYFGRERVLGGVPCWCQGRDHQGNFLMQLGEGLGVSGDGLIYVFDDSIFAQFT